MNRRLRSLALAWLSLALIMLPACSDEGDENFPIDDNQMKRVLTVELVALLGAENNRLIHQFAAENPDIEVVMRVSNNHYRELSPWIIGKEGRGDPPDIVELTPNQMNLWYHHGKLEPLNLHESELKPLVVTAPDGNILGLKSKVNPLIVYYSQDAFRLLGIDPPDEHWDWDMLDASIAALKRAGFNVYIKLSPATLEWLAVNRFGGRIVDRSGTVFSGYLDSEAAVQAAEWIAWVGTRDEDYRQRTGPNNVPYYDPMPFDLVDGNMALAIDFAYGLQPTGTTSYERIAQRNEDIGIAPVPGGMYAGNVANMSGLAIPTYAKNKEDAMRLLRYMAKSGERYFEDIADYTLRSESSVEIQSPERLATVIGEMKRAHPAALFMYEDQHHGDNRMFFPPRRAIEQGQPVREALQQYAEEVDSEFDLFKRDLENLASCIRQATGVCRY